MPLFTTPAGVCGGLSCCPFPRLFVLGFFSKTCPFFRAQSLFQGSIPFSGLTYNTCSQQGSISKSFEDLQSVPQFQHLTCHRASPPMEHLHIHCVGPFPSGPWHLSQYHQSLFLSAGRASMSKGTIPILSMECGSFSKPCPFAGFVIDLVFEKNLCWSHTCKCLFFHLVHPSKQVIENSLGFGQAEHAKNIFSY